MMMVSLLDQALTCCCLKAYIPKQAGININLDSGARELLTVPSWLEWGEGGGGGGGDWVVGVLDS